MASDARPWIPTGSVLACAGVLLVGACAKDAGPFASPAVPLAYTRFVNVVPDTFAMDYRFVDQVEGSPVTLGLAFRSFTPYQATAPGSRHIRVFPTSTDINVTSRFALDTTIAFEAGTYYTIAHVGFARTGSAPRQQFIVIADAAPNAGASVAVRAIHYALGSGAVDVFASPTGGATALPLSPAFGGVAFGTATSYAMLTPGTLALRATATGTRAPVLADNTAPAGLPADPSPAVNLQAVGGSSQAGSAMLAILTPRSVAGSAAPQGSAFTVPAFVYLIDKHPR